MPRKLPALIALGLLTAPACDKGNEPSTAPETQAASADADTKTEAGETEAAEGEEPSAKEEEKEKDHITVATFNLAWAHDNIGGDAKAAEANQAKTDEDWSWKAQQIGKLLAEVDADIVALHELGGSGELNDIASACLEAKGPDYSWAYEDSTDAKSGHNTAILSKMTISGERRFDIFMRRHVVADVELPNGDNIAVVAVHTPEGSRDKVAKARIKQVQALEKELRSIRSKGPVIIMGTFGSGVAPGDDGYKKSAAGMLAGADTGKEDDDCYDSADVGPISATTTDDKLADRIFSCGLEMRDANTAGEQSIVREARDEWKDPWSAVPVDKAPHRDISDHLIVVAEVALPKPPPEEKKESEDEGKKKEE